MANTKSAAKRARVSRRRAAINKKSAASYKQVEKKLKALVSSGKKEEAAKLLPEVQAKVDCAAKSRTIHPNKAARVKSRMAKLLKK